jgi:hypothetical protein
MLFAELKNRLSAIRPKQGTRAISHENCSVYSTDQQIVTLSWGWGFNEANVLSFDLGCHGPEHANTRAALSAARRLLPIDHWWADPPNFDEAVPMKPAPRLRRFFLHLRGATEETRDTEGREFSSFEELIDCVLTSARDIMAGDLKVGLLDLRLRIDAEDDTGEIVHSLLFVSAVTILHPAPAAPRGARLQ